MLVSSRKRWVRVVLQGKFATGTPSAVLGPMRRLTTSFALLCGALTLVACGSNDKSGEGGEKQAGDTDSGTNATSATGVGGSGSSSDSSSATGSSVTGSSPIVGSNVSSTSGAVASATSGSGGSAAGTDGSPLTGDEADGGGSVGGGAGAGNDPVELEPDVLTAGIWDDNLNFDWFSGYYKDQNAAQLSGWFTSDDHDAAHESYLQQSGSYDTLDIALVIDTTGSMGDELQYLQVEFGAISSAIEERYQHAQQRWSLVVYRDEGDEYVTRTFDFNSDLDVFRTDLADQTYGGGGDFPEAPDRALEDMNQLDWRDDEGTMRLAFWVADAPHHDNNVGRLTQAVKDAQEQGIRINPIASSGIDEFTELTMRSTAQLTHGQYMFLTDDSGVGGEHKEPTIPCYYVTTLANGLVRIVDAAMSGEPAPVDQNEVVRMVGKPNASGTCAIKDTEAVAF